MKSGEIKKKFLKFFENRDHAILESAPLIPENDSSTLFNTAGMQPLVPYLMGEKHPKGKRLVSCQKCIRTNDIDEVGDNTHHVFFEMLGNWSLGDYWKKESLNWSYEFLTNKEEGLGLDPERLYVTVFAGNSDAPKDNESIEIWKKIGIPENRIYELEDNWWSAGKSGPCGPDSEIFYDVKGGLDLKSKEEFLKADEKQEVVEIWNNVFMEYESKDGKVVGNLPQRNVDTGAGLERLTTIVNGAENFWEAEFILENDKNSKEGKGGFTTPNKNLIKVLDFFRTAFELKKLGIELGNTDRNYIYKKLISFLATVRKPEEGGTFLPLYANEKQKAYLNRFLQVNNKPEEVFKNTSKIFEDMKVMFEKRNKTKEKLESFFEKNNWSQLNKKEVFDLITERGVSYNDIKDIYKEKTGEEIHVKVSDIEDLINEHKEKSKAGAEKKFKGGLGGDSPIITAYHTATHLMLAGLRKILGNHVEQAGSNITEDRARFDFTHGEKVEREILDKVEEYVNQAIEKECFIEIAEEDRNEAKERGVVGSFWEKYPDIVKVYKIVDKEGNVYSEELCGGPHVENTKEIKVFGKFKIKKEESSSAGVRRVKTIFLK